MSRHPLAHDAGALPPGPRVNPTTVPPSGRPAANSVPPCRCATSRTMASPSPETGEAARGGRAVEAFEDVRRVGGVDARSPVEHLDPAGSDAHLHRLGAVRVELDRVV